MAGSGILERDLDMFKFLMRLSTVRGQDGTGIFQGTFHHGGKNTYLIEKSTFEVNSFFRFNQNKLLLKSTVDNVFIGHTRWATKGSLDEENCHPFDIGDIVGVHNGTLVDDKYESKNTVDSLLLYRDIEKRGLKKVLESLDADSAYALSFFNKKENRLYFARNDKRPLAVCNLKDRKVMYWASEWQMLEYAMKIRGFDNHEIGEFGTGGIYSLDLTDIPRTKVKFNIETFSPPKKKMKKIDKEVRALWKRFSKEYLANNNDHPWVNDEVDLTKVIPLNLPKVGPINNIKRGKIPVVNCFTCNSPLNLLQQYRATKVKVEKETLYECTKCVELTQQVLEAHRDRVSIN